MVAAGLVATAGAAATAAATAASTIVEGEVVASSSRWTDDGRGIFTETLVRTRDGRELVLYQPGGSTGGIGMVVSHGPAIPRVGESITAEVTLRRNGRGAWLHVVDALAVAQPLAFGGDRPEPGYVRTRTPKSGTGLYWAQSCVFVTYDAAGTSHVQGEDEFAVMDQVLATWEAATGTCSYLRFRVDDRASAETLYDGVNVIKWREQSWCRPASGTEPEMCYSSGAAALTTLFFVDDPESERDGEIVDADIEMNGVHFATSVGGVTLSAAPCMADLANTLTHEVGHLMGLDHTCWDGSSPRGVDDQGNQVPSCVPAITLPDEVTDATMYNFQSCGETKKASPSQDDSDAVCGIYPTAADPDECARIDLDGKKGCCQVSPAGGAGGGTAATTALVLVALALGLAAWRTARASGKRRGGL
jgi:hypothetical protein